MQEPRCTPATGYRALVTLMFPPAERLRPPPMRAPITYVIDYSRRHWDDPGAIRAFADFMAISASCDALMFESESVITLSNGRAAEVLVFDLAA